MNLNHSYKLHLPPATNLVDRLRYWGVHQGSQPAFYFLDERGEIQQVTYRELDEQARAIASSLAARGLEGERALLLYPPGLEFVAAFFGCLYAGVTAVPALPPRRNRNIARVEGISEDALAAIVLSVQDVIERSERVLDNNASHLKSVEWLATNHVSLKHANDWIPSDVVDTTLAVLQYTSGSTGNPKGVMLTHGNLMHNCSLITYGFEADQNSLGLSWLPTYHDMGLVGGILNPMYIGRPNVLMSPMAFLQKPVRWLRGISDLKITISGGPNFAYALCNEMVSEDDCRGLDLSSWKVAYNGAEPIRAVTLAKFTEKFKPYGFRAESHYPCYGMAETTLIVSGAECRKHPFVYNVDANALEENRVVPVSDGSEAARSLVASGRVLPDQQVLIVDPDTCEQLSNDQIGEIWVESNSVALGYWKNEEETRRAFKGRLANREKGRFLRTGDLGFFHADQLFVMGRTKELIIINGRNLYPNDIELIFEQAHNAIRIGGGAAFSIDIDDSEQLIIVQELRRGQPEYDTSEITSAIRQALFESLDVIPHSIVLLKTGKLPKTSSGKVRRRECRKAFLSGQLVGVARWQRGQESISKPCEDASPIARSPATPTTASAGVIESWLIDKIAERLKAKPSDLDVNASFAQFGLDSVALMGISGELEDWMDRTVSPKLLFNYPSIFELSNYLATSEAIERRLPVPKLMPSRSVPITSGMHDRFVPVGADIEAGETLDNIDQMSESEVDGILKKVLNLDLASKRILLAKLLQGKSDWVPVDHPMSHGQRALWFIYQLDRDSAAYNIMYAARVNSGFDRKAFCRAFQSIVNRHEILRTTYSTLDGLPVQKVNPYQELELVTVDARSWPQARLDAEIQSAADAPFDLEMGPVVRVQQFERSGSHDVLLFVAHHIALDFWSIDLLFDELENLYHSEVSGQKTSLPTAGAYNDFVRWQQQILAGEEAELQWEYWREHLCRDLPVLELPTDHPRPPIQTSRGKSSHSRLPSDLSKKLVAVSRSQDATLFATFLAAFHVFLYRYSGQDDILVGVPTAGRTPGEFENVLGYFVNPIVVRGKLTPIEPFSIFLQQVRKSLIGGMTNQDYPFPMLVERLETTRDASRSPVFQVAMGWEQPRKMLFDEEPGKRTNGKPVHPASLDLKPFMLGQQGSAFDLMLMVLDVGDTFSVAFQYNSDLFEESTIARMICHFQTLLEGIIDNPDSPIADLPLLNRAEEHQLVETWNQTTSEYSHGNCIHDLFETQVKQTPNAIAVQYRERQLTYRELNESANQVAQYLAKLGVGPDVPVAVFIDRSIEMLVCLLGVLKAGGAFVPLAPGIPRNRLAYLLKEIQSPVVLTTQKLSGGLPQLSGQIVCVDRDWTKIEKEDKTDPGRRSGPSNLAYVIFTSGSTGKPKGVEIEHRSVVNLLTSMRREPGIDSEDVLLAVTTFSFDISVLELYLPLTVGAKVVVVSDHVAADGIQLMNTIDDVNATIMQATPATWRLLVEAGWTGNRRMKILCGGEALPPDLASNLLDRCSSLWNMYGPTETTIWSTIDRVGEPSDLMPIGHPIANTQIYLLDDRLTPVPFGVTGNLYIGGHGLARGYLNQRELTETMFVNNPFRGNGEERMYRTGDLARFRNDGKIEFLGRKDSQIKFCGFRIELGEIETRLTDHPLIRQTVVAARESSNGSKQLVAYFTHHNVPNASDLRDFLRQHLPDYMIPTVFVPLKEFPLNPAGKINRNLLPSPNGTRPDLRAAFVKPRNPTEETLAAIWAKVLGLDQVGIHDNFFDLGGASMRSLEITTLAGESGIEVLPASFFRHPTIAELSASGSLKAENGIRETETDGYETRPCTISHSNNATDPRANPRKFALKSFKAETGKTNIIIESIGVYLPPNSTSTEDVIAGCKNQVWFPLEEMTGIKSRRVADDDEFTSDLACNAVAECLDNSKYTQDEIDLIICCHIGRDEAPNSAALEPGTAMYLKKRFGFPNAIAFDISNACAGMFTGISIAESYIQSGQARTAMVISAEHLSPVTKTAQKEVSGFMDQRIACLTLGDAGAAIILEDTPSADTGFHELEMYSLSKHSSMCVGRPTKQEHGGPILVIPDPIKHTTIAIENSIAHSKHIMDCSSWDPEAVQHIIMHQTSERSLLDGAREINQTFQRKICTQENTINNLSERGNTASTSHFVAVWDNILNGRIKTGDNVVFAITGSGQTIGTGIYTFDDLPNRIRNQKELRHPGKKVRKIDPPSNRGSTSQLSRIQVASIGVLSPESDVRVETIPMVKEAVGNCLAKSMHDKSEIDLVLFAGVYRTDFISEPALAAMIAAELRINDEVKPSDEHRTFAFDVINGGVGLLNACDIAAQMIRNGKIRTALIIAAEVENNRENYPDNVLGLKETASAIILDQNSEAKNGFGVFVFKYLPQNLESRIVTGKYIGGDPRVCLEQDPDISSHFLKIIPQAVNELLVKEGLALSEISIVMPPQFSGDFLTELGSSLGISRDRFVDLNDEDKDWFTSAFPYAFHRIETQSLAEPGDIGLVINVGSGLQVGCAIYYF